MVVKAVLVVGTLGFSMIVGYWGYWVIHYTINPSEEN